MMKVAELTYRRPGIHYRQKSANESTTPARLAVSSTGPSPSHDALHPKQASLHPSLWAAAA
jgi:hypothetical protein